MAHLDTLRALTLAKEKSVKFLLSTNPKTKEQLSACLEIAFNDGAQFFLDQITERNVKRNTIEEQSGVESQEDDVQYRNNHLAQVLKP